MHLVQKSANLFSVRSQILNFDPIPTNRIEDLDGAINNIQSGGQLIGEQAGGHENANGDEVTNGSLNLVLSAHLVQNIADDVGVLALPLLYLGREIDRK